MGRSNSFLGMEEVTISTERGEFGGREEIKKEESRYTQGWCWSLGCSSSQDSGQDARPGCPDIVIVMTALY